MPVRSQEPMVTSPLPSVMMTKALLDVRAIKSRLDDARQCFAKRGGGVEGRYDEGHQRQADPPELTRLTSGLERAVASASLSTDDWQTLGEMKANGKGSSKYSVDESNKMLVLRIETSTFPNWNGAEQRRPFTSLGTNSPTRPLVDSAPPPSRRDVCRDYGRKVIIISHKFLCGRIQSKRS